MVEIEGSEVGYVRSARVSVTYDDQMHKAYVNFQREPTWAEGDTLEVFGGGGYNHLSRFYGTIIAGDNLLSDNSFQITAYGPSYQLTKYFVPGANGLSLAELLGVSGTDQAIVSATLAQAGAVDIGTILGTGIVRGALAPAAFHWRRGTNALAQIKRIDEASLGYKLVEEGADLSRRLLSKRPAVSASKTFTEGLDIMDARATKSNAQRWAAWSVTGYNFGAGDGAVTGLYPAEPGSVAVRTFQSDMIERALNADPGTGLSAEDVLDWLRDEEDHAQVRVGGLSTLRDESVTIGETHQITSARLNVNAKFVVVSKNVEIGPTRFTQAFDYEGGT